MGDPRCTKQDWRTRRDSQCLGRPNMDCYVRLYREANGGGRLHLSNLSGSRESLLNQDEFRLQRWRKRIDFCREVLFDLCEMRIQDSDDCGRKLLEFVQVGALSQERLETALGYSERAGHRNRTIVRM